MSRSTLTGILAVILSVITLTGTSASAADSTITYYGNGNTGGTAPASQIKQEFVDLSLAEKGDLLRDGYVFNGWNTAADGSGTAYAVRGTYTVEADLTLYADWLKVDHWTPSQLSNVAWYDASDTNSVQLDGNGNVQLWYDRSGNGRHAVQALESYRPQSGSRTMGGSNVIDFVGTNFLIHENLGISPTGDYTIAMAVDIDSVVNERSSLVSLGHFVGLRLGAGHWTDYYTTQFDGDLEVYFSGGGHAYVEMTNGPFAGKNLFAVTCDKTVNNKLSVHANGVSDGQLGYSGGLFDQDTLAIFSMAQGWPSSPKTVDGAAGEFIITTDTSEEARQKIEGYLAHKWGLTNNLPANHPYKSQRPLLPTTVHYEGNGETAGSAPADQVKVQSLELAEKGSLAKDGYIFYGWNTAADGSGTTYSAGETYSAEGDLTLYARWNVDGSGSNTNWTPSQLSNVVWYDASDTNSVQLDGNGNVQLWYDRSGNGRHAVQALESCRPQSGSRTMGGSNVIDFVGTNFLIHENLGISPTGDYTIAMAVDIDSVVNERSSLVSLGHFVGLRLGAGHWTDYYTTQFDGDLEVYFSGGGHAYVEMTNGPFAGKNLFAVTCDKTVNNKLSVHANGVLDGQLGYSGGLFDQDTLTIFSMARGWPNPRTLDGAAGEFIITTDTSEEARQKLEGYLAHKWGLTNNLPFNHPYRFDPPVIHVVTFVEGAHGTRTGGGALVQAVDHGSAAAAPTITANAGYTFTGWDVAFDNVTSDLTVTAVYSVIRARGTLFVFH